MARKIFISIILSAFGVLLFDNSSVFAQHLPTGDTIAKTDRLMLETDRLTPEKDSLTPEKDSLTSEKDSLAAQQDSLATPNDSTAPRSQSAITSRIDYKAQDSLSFDLRNNKAYLFEKAQLNYQDITLTAAHITMDFKKQEVNALPRTDSAGKQVGVPHFDDKTQVFDAQEMTYSFRSKKARIRNVVTKEGEMYVHGDLVKKLPNNETFVERARFTTCDLEEPHFHIVARRAKIIPEDKVVTGGAMLYLNGVPTPVVLPFGLFPNTSSRRSGILIPTYGESFAQGFYLREGGFYWGINDFMDWKITGDIYTRGEWAIRNTFNYAKRYKFSGSLFFKYGEVPVGEKETPNYSKSKSLEFNWSHAQDAKANQNSRFSASVNFYNHASQQYSSLITDRFNPESRSNIAYQLRLANRFNISTTANLNYNMATRNINATLPTISFSMDPIYPFQRKVRKGKARWYESFKINYSMNATNQINLTDSLFFTPEMSKNMRNGIKHSIPMDLNIKLLNGKLNWGHSVNFTEYWYFKSIRRDLDSLNRPAIVGENYGFFATRDYGYSTSLSTTLYGLLQFKRGLFRAFRHEMTPSVGFSMRPDFYTYEAGYRYYGNTLGEPVRYNIFEGTPYGMPQGVKSGSINFALSNRFEMKVRDRKDTITGTRKVRILESFDLSTSYNLAADSLNWAPINLSARTTLFKNLHLNYNAQFSLYAKDSNHNSYNKFLWETGDKFLLTESTSMSTGLSWSLKSKDKKSESATDAQSTEIFGLPSAFGANWTLNINYTIRYGSNYRPGYYYTDIFGYPRRDTLYSEYYRNISQTLSISGNVQLTPKWNITYQTGFDFTTKRLSQTTFTISRDLHCWDMAFTWTPFGDYKEWSFSIKLKPGMLSDALKYDKRSSFRDGTEYQ